MSQRDCYPSDSFFCVREVGEHKPVEVFLRVVVIGQGLVQKDVEAIDLRFQVIIMYAAVGVAAGDRDESDLLVFGDQFFW